MGSPCEPLTARQELIATLEELGYDGAGIDGVKPADWRASMTDAEMRAAISAAEAVLECPDISELVEAIRETVKAAEAYNAAYPSELRHRSSHEGQRYCAAFARLTDLLSDCDKAMEAFGS